MKENERMFESFKFLLYVPLLSITSHSFFITKLIDKAPRTLANSSIPTKTYQTPKT